MSKAVDMEAIGGFTIYAIVAIALTTAIVCLNGLLVMYYWDWFLVPVFGIQNLSLAQSIGVASVFGVLAKRFDKYEIEKLPTIAAYYPTAFLFGWILHFFIL